MEETEQGSTRQTSKMTTLIAQTNPVHFLALLFVLMGLCLFYLTVDWLVDEWKRERANKKELEDWNVDYDNAKRKPRTDNPSRD
jgi:hypothetical protein